MKKIFLSIIFMVNLLYADTVKQVSLQLSWLHQFQFAGYYIAKEKGYYKDVGLEVKIKEYSEDATKTKSDFTIRKSSTIIDKMNKVQITALGASFQHSPMMLLTLKSSGIETPRDLAGKKVMVTSDAKESGAIIAMLNSFGLDRKTVDFVSHSFSLEDLINKKTDAMACYISNEPIKLKELGIPYNMIHPKEYGFDFYEDFLVVENSFLKENPKVVEDFYIATLKGWEYAYNNIEESSRIIYEKYNTQNKSLYNLIQEGEILKTIAYDKDGNIGRLKEDKIAEMGSVFKVLGLCKNDFIPKDFIYIHNTPPIIYFEYDEHIKIIITFIVLLIFTIIVLSLYYTKRLQEQMVEKNIANDEANRQKDFLQKVIDSMGNIVVVTDTKNRKLMMANSELFRSLKIESIEEFEKKYECICDLFVAKEGYLQKYNDGIYWIDYLQMHNNTIHKVILSCKDEEHLYFVYAKLIDKANSAVLSVFTDITDLKALDDRISNEAKLEALGDLISNIAHHWRQPLSMISTLASITMINLEMGENNLDEIKGNSQKIINITQELSKTLDIFRHRLDEKENLQETLTLEELIFSVESYFAPIVNKDTIALEITIQEDIKKQDIKKILFDILKEIIQNSVEILKLKIEQKNKMIHLDIVQNKSEIVFDIYDNGGGVDVKNITKMFEPYFTTYHQSQGKGLGLFFVKNLLDRFPNSNIEVKNKTYKYEDVEVVGLETIIKVGI